MKIIKIYIKIQILLYSTKPFCNRSKKVKKNHFYPKICMNLRGSLYNFFKFKTLEDVNLTCKLTSLISFTTITHKYMNNLEYSNVKA